MSDREHPYADEFHFPAVPSSPELLAHIYGPDGRVRYRRPLGHPLIAQVEDAIGYSVEIGPDPHAQRRK